MIKRISFSINFGSVFISISLDILNIKVEEDSNIDKLENFNADIQIYLVFEREYEEFIVIRVNLSIVKKDNEKRLYLEFNNVGYDGIV